MLINKLKKVTAFEKDQITLSCKWYSVNSNSSFCQPSFVGLPRPRSRFKIQFLNVNVSEHKQAQAPIYKTRKYH